MDYEWLGSPCANGYSPFHWSLVPLPLTPARPREERIEPRTRPGNATTSAPRNARRVPNASLPEAPGFPWKTRRQSSGRRMEVESCQPRPPKPVLLQADRRSRATGCAWMSMGVSRRCSSMAVDVSTSAHSSSPHFSPGAVMIAEDFGPVYTRGQKTREGAASAVRHRHDHRHRGQTSETQELFDADKRPGEKCGLGTAYAAARDGAIENARPDGRVEECLRILPASFEMQPKCQHPACSRILMGVHDGSVSWSPCVC